MARADARAVVAVKVFIEGDEIAPVRVALELLGAAVNRAATLCITNEDSRQAPRQLRRYLPERHHLARTARKSDFKTLSKEVIELLERLDEKIVHWKPDRPAPVRVATEQIAGGLGRFIVHTVYAVADLQ